LIVDIDIRPSGYFMVRPHTIGMSDELADKLYRSDEPTEVELLVTTMQNAMTMLNMRELRGRC
jgi:hypothetical protein